MIAPHIINTLSKHYQEKYEHYTNPIPLLPVTNNQLVNMENSELVVDSDDLWEMVEPQLASSQFYSICVSGQQGSGKTTVARELLGKAEEAGYFPLFSSGEDIIKFAIRGRQEAQGAKKVAILFDDMSYVLATLSGKIQGATKNWIAKIRHYFKAKLFIIFNVHIYTGIPPIFRNTSEWIFTKPSMLEYETIMALSAHEPEEREEADIMFKNVMDLQEVLRKQGVVNFTYNKSKYQFVLGTDEKNRGDGRLMLLMTNGTPYFYRAQLITDKSLKSYSIGTEVNVNTDIFLPKEEKKKTPQQKQQQTPVSKDEEEFLNDGEEDEEKEESQEENEEEVPEEPEPVPEPLPIPKEVAKPRAEKVKRPNNEVEQWDEQKRLFYDTLKKNNPTWTDKQIKEMIDLAK